MPEPMLRVEKIAMPSTQEFSLPNPRVYLVFNRDLTWAERRWIEDQEDYVLSPQPKHDPWTMPFSHFINIVEPAVEGSEPQDYVAALHAMTEAIWTGGQKLVDSKAKEIEGWNIFAGEINDLL